MTTHIPRTEQLVAQCEQEINSLRNKRTAIMSDISAAEERNKGAADEFVKIIELIHAMTSAIPSQALTSMYVKPVCHDNIHVVVMKQDGWPALRGWAEGSPYSEHIAFAFREVSEIFWSRLDDIRAATEVVNNMRTLLNETDSKIGKREYMLDNLWKALRPFME